MDRQFDPEAPEAIIIVYRFYDREEERQRGERCGVLFMFALLIILTGTICPLIIYFLLPYHKNFFASLLIFSAGVTPLVMGVLIWDTWYHRLDFGTR
jgi:hypothetical protein